MTLKIELGEGDFGEVMTPAERRAIFGTERVLQEPSASRSTGEMLEELLPRALVAKIRKLTPPDFELQEITIDAEVSGKIFGSGVTGNFSMKLSRRTGPVARTGARDA